MKILHVYKTYYPLSFGGIEKCIETLCINAKELGVQSEVLSIHNEKNIVTHNHNGIASTFYPKTWEGFSCPLSLSMFKHFVQKAQQFDIIHYHFPWPFADLLSLFAKVKKPYVITYHSDIIRQKLFMPVYAPFMKRFFLKASAIVATSQNYVDSSKILREVRHQVKVVPIGLVDKYNDKIEGYSHPKPYFLFLGVLRHYKGLNYLIDAMRGVVDYDLIIAGDGPCYPALKKQISELGLSNVKLLGQVSDEQKYGLYKGAFAVVSAAHLRNEAYCYMLVEGLMFGKPLISTNLHTGTTFVNKEGETGIVVPPANSVALRAAMEQLFYCSDYQRFSHSARKRFVDYLTTKKMSRDYHALYCEALGL